MRLFIVFLFFLTALCAYAGAERLFYLSNGEVLQGCVYKPRGEGPFPVVVFNHNTSRPWSDKGPFDPYPELAAFFTKQRYVLFGPGRRNAKDEDDGSGKNSGQESETDIDDVEHERKLSRIDEQRAETIFAAIETIKAQSYVDPKRIFVIGQQAGGITSLRLAEKDLDVKGYVVFSPASGVWKRSPFLQSELKRAVRNANAPIFLIQPENDLSLYPAQILGPELKKKGPPNAAKIYLPFGKNAKESVQFSQLGPSVWGDDVLSFFQECLKH